MIEVKGLSKSYGSIAAVSNLSFEVTPGTVTGFLGPNGAGKSTTMRMIMGIDHPTSGEALINGHRYRDLAQPLRTVGALLEAKAYHPGRTAENHLLAVAAANRLPTSRVREVLEQTGLTSVANRRAGNFSLGMSQRLGIATALLGDPEILLLDEPVNGLDPEGIQWIRGLMHSLAERGRTVFVSSHLMSEMALTATHVIVIGQGKLIADTTVDNFIAEHSEAKTKVRSPQSNQLEALLATTSATLNRLDDQTLEVAGVSTEQIGEVAASNSITLHELSPMVASLEEVFMELTQGSVQYRATEPVGAAS
jgi:ABC-2 type transport system ATP-binding protein